MALQIAEIDLRTIQKKEILKITLLQFRKYGFKHVSMDDLSTFLGISKTSLYTFYRSKMELVETTFKVHLLQWDDHIYKITKKNYNPIQTIINIYQYILNQLVDINPVFFQDLKKYYPEGYDLYLHFKQQLVYNLTLGLLKKAEDTGMLLENINLNMVCKLHFFNLENLVNSYEVFDNEIVIDDLLQHVITNNLNGILKLEYRNTINLMIES